MKFWIRDYFIISFSGQFDSKYYLHEYEDIRSADIYPLLHFVRFGWKEGRNPSPAFDTNYYIETNSDVKKSNVNPLVHYIRYGKKEGRRIAATDSSKTSQYSSSLALKTLNSKKREDGSLVNWDSKSKVMKSIIFIKNYGLLEFIKKVRSKLQPSTSTTVSRLKLYKANVYSPDFMKLYDEMMSNSKSIRSQEYVEFNETLTPIASPKVKYLAFYLPQFHPFPENDLWWGKGFTEWVNVSKAAPQFYSHYQPRYPGELGYYDLRVPDIQRRQVELAKTYGVYGFCFHFYWFNGKRLLDMPLDQFVNDPEIDFPFCVCWANENWTRRWDGRSEEILIAQEHSFEYDSAIIFDFLKLFENPRYIRINNRPLLIVYRADLLKDARDTLDYWRKCSVEKGLGDPFILAAQTFGYCDPRNDGFDGAVEFPPHNGEAIPEISASLDFYNPEYSGKVFRYVDFVDSSIRRIKVEPYLRLNTVFPSWDNEPRRPGKGMTFAESSPTIYGRWLESVSRFAINNLPTEERIVFINAWNEWGEGAYLEPDRRFGYAYLQATYEILQKLNNPVEISSFTIESISDHHEPKNIFQHRFESVINQWPMYAHDTGTKNTDSLHTVTTAIDNLLSVKIEDDLNPVASIIIPVFNHFEETLNCIKSIIDTDDKSSFEIIIADDCSTDETYEVFSKCKHIRYIRNETNLGFLLSCNYAARSAKGSYLILLNNDTIVCKGWLDELVLTFNEVPDAGLVGSKLIYPDGRLQEAGGVIWSDASGINYGRNDDPNKPEYNYLREVDYCSGASICIPRSIWQEIGGFDSLFSPAYYEDTDLAFRIRRSGYKVLFQPMSQVIHIEGATSGTDISQGIKHYQEINREKFHLRWKDVLMIHGDCSLPEINYRNRARPKNCLVIDVCTPKPDQDAGSIDTYHYLLTLRKLGFEVTFISVVDSHVMDRYVLDLQKKGVQCIYDPYLGSIDAFIKANGKNYDLVFLVRAPFGGKYIDTVRKYSPGAKIVFNTIDLHFLREKREKEIAKKDGSKSLHQEGVSEADEIRIMKQSDRTIVVSEHEQELLNLLVPNNNSVVIPLTSEIPGFQGSFDIRHDIVFIGGFLHKPNVDAVLYFVKEIWPLIANQLPKCRFLVVGSNVPDEIRELASETIEIVGYVKDLTNIFSNCRLSVAPLRFGAGIKGKIITSMSYGVPCVGTSIAVEGMGLTDGENIVVRDIPIEFASAVVNLYNNRENWNRVSEHGLAFVKGKYSLETFENNLRQLINGLGIEPDATPKIVPEKQ